MRKIKITLFSFVLSVSNLIANNFITHVTLTTYNAVKEQCDSDPTTTADGTKIDFAKLSRGELKIVAISRDLKWCLPFGSVIEIEGHGRYVVADLMNARYNHCIDILQPVGKKDFKKENVKVKLIRTKKNQ